MEMYAVSNENALMLTGPKSVSCGSNSQISAVELSADIQGNGTVWQGEE